MSCRPGYRLLAASCDGRTSVRPDVKWTPAQQTIRRLDVHAGDTAIRSRWARHDEPASRAGEVEPPVGRTVRAAPGFLVDETAHSARSRAPTDPVSERCGIKLLIVVCEIASAASDRRERSRPSRPRLIRQPLATVCSCTAEFDRVSQIDRRDRARVGGVEPDAQDTTVLHRSEPRLPFGQPSTTRHRDLHRHHDEQPTMSLTSVPGRLAPPRPVRHRSRSARRPVLKRR